MEAMAMIDRMSVDHHGRRLGTASGWDGDPGEYLIYQDFHPAEGIPFDRGLDLNIDESNGWIYTIDRDGTNGTKFDLPTFLAGIPRTIP